MKSLVQCKLFLWAFKENDVSMVNICLVSSDTDGFEFRTGAEAVSIEAYNSLCRTQRILETLPFM